MTLRTFSFGREGGDFSFPLTGMPLTKVSWKQNKTKFDLLLCQGWGESINIQIIF